MIKTQMDFRLSFSLILLPGASNWSEGVSAEGLWMHFSWYVSHSRNLQALVAGYNSDEDAWLYDSFFDFMDATDAFVFNSSKKADAVTDDYLKADAVTDDYLKAKESKGRSGRRNYLTVDPCFSTLNKE